MEKPAQSTDLNDPEINILMLWIGAAFIVQFIVLIAAQVQLAGDGSSYLYSLMVRPLPFGWDFSRRFAHAIAQMPIVIAIHAGVTSVPVLSRFLGIGFMLPSALSLILCSRIGRHRPDATLFVFLSSAAVTSNVSFFMVTESNILVALFWPLVLLFTVQLEWTRGTWLLAAALAVPTLRAYESMVLLGSVLTGLAVWRSARASNAGDVRSRNGFIAFAVYFVFGIAIGAWFVAHPRDPGNLHGFVQSWRFYDDGQGHLHLPGLISLATVIIIALAVFTRDRSTWLYRVLLGLLAIAGIGAALSPVFSDVSIAPVLHARARTLNAYLPPLFAIMLIAVLVRPLSQKRMRFAYSAVAILAATQLVWNSLAAKEWVNYLHVFQNEVAHREGLIPYKESALSNQYIDGEPVAVMNWSWTMPVMSILMSPHGNVQAMIENPSPADWQPFDPRRPDLLPSLSHYGIHYERYSAALARKSVTPPAAM
jgi:hypothetical protein